MTKRTRLGLLREIKAQTIGDIDWLNDQRMRYSNLIRKKNEVLDDIEGEILEELRRLSPVAKGTPISIEFVSPNADD
jgi:hypothetical protein